METESKTSRADKFAWQAPKAYLLWQSHQQMKEGRGSFVRTALIVAVFFGVLYVLAEPLPWEEAGLNINHLFFMTLAGGLGFCAAAYFVGSYLSRFGRVFYVVNAKGICIRGGLYRWRSICGCQPPEANEPIEGVLSVRFRTLAFERPVSLIFDGEQAEMADAVYRHIEAHIPAKNRLDQKPILKLTKPQHWIMVALCISLGILLRFTLMPYCFRHSGMAAVLFLLLLVFAGPGTWGILAFYGKRVFKYRKWFGLMYAYNALTLLVLLLTGIVYEIVRLRTL